MGCVVKHMVQANARPLSTKSNYCSFHVQSPNNFNLCIFKANLNFCPWTKSRITSNSVRLWPHPVAFWIHRQLSNKKISPNTKFSIPQCLYFIGHYWGACTLILGCSIQDWSWINWAIVVGAFLGGSLSQTQFVYLHKYPIFWGSFEKNMIKLD